MIDILIILKLVLLLTLFFYERSFNMRYYGTLTGNVYEREEAPKSFKKYMVECVDVNAEDGTHYDKLLISLCNNNVTNECICRVYYKLVCC